MWILLFIFSYVNHQSKKLTPFTDACAWFNAESRWSARSSKLKSERRRRRRRSRPRIFSRRLASSASTRRSILWICMRRRRRRAIRSTIYFLVPNIIYQVFNISKSIALQYFFNLLNQWHHNVFQFIKFNFPLVHFRTNNFRKNNFRKNNYSKRNLQLQF